MNKFYCLSETYNLDPFFDPIFDPVLNANLLTYADVKVTTKTCYISLLAPNYFIAMMSRNMNVRTRRAYCEATLQLAVESVGKKTLNVTQAANLYKIPRQTLADKVTGNHGGKYGKQPALSAEDEKLLAEYVKYMGSINYPLSVSDIKVFASSIAKRSSNPHCFLECGPTEKWWRGFKKRHPELTVRKPDKLDRRRNAMAKKSIVASHFDKLEALLEENGLSKKSSHIFNVDESGMEMDAAEGKVVVDRTSKNAYQETGGAREHITTNVCCSASGQILPPMIIFKTSFPSGHYSQNGPDECLYARSPNGWMDSELFSDWFRKLFLPKTSHLRISLPVLLILDGHNSHLTLELIDLARSNNVILFCLPPHLTHMLQPLDVAVFRSLKAHFAKIKHRVKILTLGTERVLNVNRTNFSAIFREAFEQCMVMATIKNGFRKCGIHPFSPAAIDWSKLIDDTVPTENKAVNILCPAADSSAGPSSQPTSVESSIRNHPIMENGMIPSRLVNVLVIPHVTQQKTRNTRCVTTSRVLTSDEHHDMVKTKIEAAELAETEKIKRKEERERKKQEREQKRQEREQKKEQKQAGKNGARKFQYSAKVKKVRTSRRLETRPKKNFADILSNTSSDDVSSDENGENTCALCHKKAPDGDTEDIDWIQCDRCAAWYHVECEDPEQGPDQGPYTCKECS